MIYVKKSVVQIESGGKKCNIIVLEEQNSDSNPQQMINSVLVLKRINKTEEKINQINRRAQNKQREE